MSCSTSLCSAVCCIPDAVLLLCSKLFVAVRSAAVCRISHSLSAAKSEYVKPCTASFSIMRFRYLHCAQYDLICVKSAIKPQPTNQVFTSQSTLMLCPHKGNHCHQCHHQKNISSEPLQCAQYIIQQSVGHLSLLLLKQQVSVGDDDGVCVGVGVVCCSWKADLNWKL